MSSEMKLNSDIVRISLQQGGHALIKKCSVVHVEQSKVGTYVKTSDGGFWIGDGIDSFLQKIGWATPTPDARPAGSTVADPTWLKKGGGCDAPI